MKRFEITETKNLGKFLNITIKRFESSLGSRVNLLKEYNIHECNPVITPTVSGKDKVSDASNDTIDVKSRNDKGIIISRQ